jgi:N-acetylmuramoyl-L-alanine amidase
VTAPVFHDRPSPNCGPRKDGARIDLLVLHYTGMKSCAEAIERLCDPSAQVSAHYVIDEDGTIWRLVDESLRAWHAGESAWRGNADVNSRSIGIELVNPGHEFGYRDFPAAQMEALIALARDIVDRHGIRPIDVVGHSDVAPARKMDPGEKFNWRALAAAGIGVWPKRPSIAARLDTGPYGDERVMLTEAQTRLARIGYGIEATGRADESTAAVLRAFQRRFRPKRIDGRLDAETFALIEAVLALAG